MLAHFAERRRDPVLMLALSVYFLLLAFFVVLSRHGEVDATRSAAVAQGLRTVFGGNSPATQQAPAPHDPELAELLQAALDSGLPIANGTIFRRATAIELRFDPDPLFAPNAAAPALAFAPLLDRLAGAARATPTGVEASVDIVAGTEDSLAAARAAAFARALGARGIADVAAGTESGQPGTLRLVFSLHGTSAP